MGFLNKDFRVEGDVIQVDCSTTLSEKIDLTKLANELDQLRHKIREDNKDGSNDEVLGDLKRAGEAARNRDGNSLLSNLKKAGKVALEVASRAGLKLAFEALDSVLP